jgi:type IV secretory pathway TrbD component
MLGVSILAARWIVPRLAIPATPSTRLLVGVIALAFMLAAEFGLVLWLRGLSIREYFATRDPVSGTVYYVALGLFALMPLFVAGT